MKRNVKLAKRLISVLLCMALILGELPLMGQKALADEPVPAAAAHTHCVCGETSCSGEGHNKSQVWTEWSNGTSLPSTAGYYYLSKDVTLNATWEPANGTYLCLNGHVVTVGTGSVVKIGYGIALTLTDCDEITVHKFTVNENGLWIMDERNGTESVVGGVITGGEARYGGGVSVDYEGVFTMYDIAIVGNTASYGGGVYNDGTTIVYAGEIVGNIANSYGGGVENNENMAMYGGEIHRNKAYMGGGVDANDTFTMYNGKVHGNIAESYGGGICSLGASAIRGGEISGNTAGKPGGGIYHAAGTITLSGSPVVCDNVVGGVMKDGVLTGGTANNVNLSQPIIVDGKLQEAYIGVTCAQGVVAEPDGTNVTDLSPYSVAFASDDEQYVVGVNSVKKLILIKAHTITFDKNHEDSVGIMDSVRVGYGTWYKLPACEFTLVGYDFVGWAYSSGGSVIGTESISVYGDKLLFAIWEPKKLTGTVEVLGMYAIGETLTAELADVNNTGELQYQWYRGEAAITGATKSTYVLQEDDVDQMISCVVTSTVQTGTLVSELVGPINRKFAEGEISAIGFEGLYDGQDHQIQVQAPEGAVITYKTELDAKYSNVNPAYREVGTYTVYYKVEKEGYCEVTGSAIVCINSSHIHCVCGETTCSGEEHSAYQMWTEWTDGTSLPSTAGYYYLSKDVTLNATWEPVNGTYLCLNGHVVKTIAGRVITIGRDNSFTLTDCNTTTTHLFSVNEDGLWVLDEVTGTQAVVGGIITGGFATGEKNANYENSGGGVLVKGSFCMYGGTVIGNRTSNNGGGVCCYFGEVKIYGGQICGNVAWRGGGIGGYFGETTLYDGVICNNTATNNGGGVDAYDTFLMHGGHIYNNTSYEGGGICTGKSLVIIGGMISENKAKEEGGGVDVWAGDFTMSGGKIISNMTEGQAAGVRVEGYNDSNIYLYGAPLVAGNISQCTVRDGEYSDGIEGNMLLPSGTVITIIDEMYEGASVGVRSEDGCIAFAVPDGINVQSLEGYEDFFFSDEWYGVGERDGKLEFTYEHIHCVCSKKSCENHSSVSWIEWRNPSELPTTAGYYYLAADVTMTGTSWAPADGTYLCLNGHVVDIPGFYVGKAYSFTLTDCDVVTEHSFTESDGCWSLDEENGTITVIGGAVVGGWNRVGGNFTMNSGTICGGSTGISVSPRGYFTMNGGTICGNSRCGVSVAGNTISYPGTFVMNGGQISNNGMEGDGVSSDIGGIIVDDSSYVTINDGKVCDNIGYGIKLFNSYEVTLNGGEITGNESQFGGCGIGVIGSSKLYIAGNPVVRDNKSHCTVTDGVYSGGQAADVVLDNLPVIVGAMTEGAMIGITLNSESGYGVFAEAGESSAVDLSAYTDYFFSNGAYAVEAQENQLMLVVSQAEGAHSHCVCNQAGCTEHYMQAWSEWTDNNALPSAAGYYYLGTDVTLASTWKPANGTYLCLNGHVVKTTSGRVIEIDYDHSFTLTDCDTTTSHRFTVNEDGLWVLDEINGTQTVTGGVITGGHADEAEMYPGRGGAIYTGGTFYMYGGNICGNVASSGSGGGICGGGNEFIYMYGGSICGNVAAPDAYGSGGGISGGYVTVIYGGEIFGNSARWGGGVSCAVIEVYGGSIRSNTAENGAGIMSQDGLFLMGGEITDNMASGHGGGIFVNDYTYTKISGKVTIADNSAGCTVTDGVYSGGVTENMYLPSGKTIAVNGELLTGSSIGITMESGIGTFAKPDGYVLTDISGLAEFFCSDEGYEIVADGANLAMQEKVLTHVHCVCGETDCSGEGHDASQAWVDWTDATSLPEESGYYYLETDVILSGAWQPANGTYLCLNGHVVTTTSGRVITINSDVTFTLTDCDTTTTHKFTVSTNGLWTLDEENGTKIVNGGAIVGGNGEKPGSYTIVGGGVYVGGTLYMNGGSICGSSVGRSGYGGGVYVDVNAQVVMNGGTICGNNGGYYGGGVYVDSGTFVMGDGSICENGSANTDGGGIYVIGAGVCTINGGEIRNNTAGFGGGIYVTDASTCTVNGGVIAGNYARFGGGLYTKALITINGGEIRGNEAECGGAVFVYKTLQLNGVSITRNTATDSGGGIHMQSTGTTVIAGGEITGNTAGVNGQGGGMYSGGDLTISGSPIIRDNVVGGAIENGQLIGGTTNNLFLFYGSRLNAFDVDGELGAETSIGISAEKTGIFARALGGASLAPYATYFFPDDESYIITTEDDDLRLSKMYRVSFDKNNAFCTGTMDSLEVLDGTVIDLSYCNFTSNGYQFIGWSYTPGKFNQVTIIEQSSIVVNENITLYAVWAPLPLTGTVYIQGELQYGQTITAIVNNTNNTGTLGYYWIGGGTGTHSEDNTYVIQAKDIGSEITCIVYSTEQSGEIVGETNAVVRGKDFGATDIVVNGYYGVYDGQSHQILVSAPEGSIVTYSTRKYGPYSTECPGYKGVGTYTVYYEVFKENYEPVRGSALIRIERKSVWINGTQVESTKVYDGTTAAEITGVGQLSVDYYDDVTIIAGAAAYSDKNVGQGKTVTFTDFALGGEDAGNYILAAQPRSVTADITPRELHVTAQVADKQYDGLDTAKFVGTPVPADLLSGDQVTLYFGTPVFSRVMVGESVPVLVDDFTISGPDAINYTVVQPNLTAKIYNAYVPEVGVDYTVNSNDWLNTAFVVTAQEGYKVSRTNTANGDWVNTLEENEDTNDGQIIFYVKRLSDGAISVAVTETYKIDKTAPTITGITDGETYYVSKTVTVVDENLASVTVNGESVEAAFQLTNDVEKTYVIVATDELGNQTTVTVTMKWYVAEAGVDYTVNSNDWLNTAFVVTASKGYKLSSANTDYRIWTDTLEETGETNDGQITFYVKRLSDGAISLAVTETYKIDKTAPEITGITDGKTYYVSKAVNVTDDNLSTVTVNGEPAEATFQLTNDVEQTYIIVATDKAGNQTSVTVTMKWYIAEAGVDYIVNSNDWLNKAFVVIPVDNHSISRTSQEDGEWLTSLKETAETDDGILTFYVKRLSDGAISQMVTEHYKIDMTAPVISGVENGGAYFGDQTITIIENNLAEVTLDGKHVDLVEGRFTIVADNEWHYINVKDKVGNIAYCSIIVFVPHVHCVCGATDCSGEGHDPTQNWSTVTGLVAISGAGYYCLGTDLTKDPTMSDPIGGWGMWADVHLCLNGHVFDGFKDASGIVSYKGEFYLTDCNETATHRFSVKDDGQWYLDEENGTEVVSGGVITGFGKGLWSTYSAPRAMVMYGGNIIGNEVGVLASDFVMYGGRICGNRGVAVNCENAFIYGGDIRNNGDGGVHANNCVTMRGGTICDNQGGGIRSLKLILSDGPIITGNKVDEAAHNVACDIVVDGALDSNARIGISLGERSGEKIIFARPDGVNVTDLSPYVDCFVVDDNRYSIIAYEGNLGLVKVDTNSPVITGVEDGATYYTTQTVTITDENLASVTVNGEPAEATFQLTNDVEKTYVIVATDEAGNQTTVTVTMKWYVAEAGVDYTVNSNGWLNTAFVVTAQEGCLLSRSGGADGNWTDTLTETEDTNDGQIIFYVKRLSDGAISLAVTELYKIDMTVPVIEGITDGAAYYTTQTVTITDENLASVTVNGELAETTFQLTNDVEKTYVIVATDEAGNQTTVTVIMKPVSDVSADIADITTEDITSEDIQEIQDVIDHIEELLEEEDLTPEDREALEEQKQAAEDLLAQVEEAQEAVQTETVEQAQEILQGEPGEEDKEVLEQAKEDLEEALENYGDNYTEEEKEEILELIARIETALEALKPCDGGDNCPSAPYTDLNPAEWYHTYVDYVIEHGLMTGTSATTFKPYDTINRASMVTILYRISGEQNTATPEEKAQWIDHLRAKMTDVIQGYWYEEAIAWAYYKGVTSGTSATTFAPEGVITREQFVLFLYKFSNYLGKETEERADLTAYPDYQSVSSWAVDGVSWGVAVGLLTGKGQPDGTSLLAPQGEASRAEAATLIARFHQR